MIPAIFLSGLGLSAISFRIFRAQLKGRMGEYAVARALRGIGATALNDVYLPGRSCITQIDHLVLTQTGIVVLETKAYGGALYDQGRGRPWRQYIGRQYHAHHNPLDQNYGHCKAVEAIVGRSIPIQGFVVLAGTGRFPHGSPSGVLTIRDLKRMLPRMGMPTSATNTSPDLVHAWEMIQSKNQQDAASREKQMRQVTGGGVRYWLEASWPWLAGAGLALMVGGALV